MENAQLKKYRMMTEAPVKPLVCKLAVPTIISMLVSSFYNMADTYFVSSIDAASVAAVGIVFPVMAIIQALGFFFGHGSGNYISRALGAHDHEGAQRMASIGFFSALIAGCIVLLLGTVFLNPLSVLLGATEETLKPVKAYLQIILIGAPYMMSQLVLNNQMRFQGNAMYSMFGVTAGAVLNIVLDPIMIHGWLGLPAMGVAGAALATIISQLVSFVLLLVGTYKSGGIMVRLRNFRPEVKCYKIIAQGGAPSLLRQGLNSIATVCLNLSAGLYGVTAIAAMSVVTRIMQFANSCLIGFGQGFQPVCGFNYGAKKYDRVKEAFWFCVILSTVVLAGLACVGLIFAPPILSVFSSGESDVLTIGARALRFQCATFPLAAWIVMCNMMTQTIGKAVRASFLAIARQGLFFIPAVLILPRIFGITGLLLAQPTADVITFLFAIPLQISLLKEMTRESKQPGFGL